MNLHVFTTGEGTPYGLAMVPVVKVSSRTALAERWPDLIDIDAGRDRHRARDHRGDGWEIFRLDAGVARADGRRGPSTGGWATRWRRSIPGR